MRSHAPPMTNPTRNTSLPCARSSTLLALLLVSLLLFSLFRLALFVDRVENLAEHAQWLFAMFGTGLRFDLSVVSLFCVPLWLWIVLAPEPWVSRASTVYASCVLGLIALSELAGMAYFRYYDFRLNYLVLEHGTDPEVLKTIWADFPVVRIMLGSLVVAWGAYHGFRHLERKLHELASTRIGVKPTLQRWLLPWLLLPLLALGIRGSLGHRGINPSLAAVSPDRVINEIAGSGVFNLIYEFEQKLEGSYVKVASLYPPLPDAEALQETRSLLATQGHFVDDAKNELLREIQNPERAKPLNVVFVVMESFTGFLVHSVGGKYDLAPGFDALAQEGILFTNCYATGERTVQGLEGSIASFPPLPGVSIVRRPEATAGFATLGHVLAERGYVTRFYYGGDGLFDQMRGFFQHNGFEDFIEQADFENPVFVSEWGVSDEDLFAKANQDFEKLHHEGKPFFASLLTVSLHSPWKYPDGRIEPLPSNFAVPKGYEYEELNNFRYADYAIGKFIRDAKQLSYFDDTLFVFVGDHGVHLRGRNLIPSEEYQVPALFLAPKHLAPERIERVTSQLDLAPTILGILGGTYRSPFFGEDVLRARDAEGFAPMIYRKRLYGVRSANRLTVLSESGETLAHEIASDGEIRAVPLSEAHTRNAKRVLAIAQTAEKQLTERRRTLD